MGNLSSVKKESTDTDSHSLLQNHLQRQVEIAKQESSWIDIRWMIPSVRVQSESGTGFYMEKEEAKAVLMTALAQANNFDGLSAQDCLENALSKTIHTNGLEITKESFLEHLNKQARPIN